MKKLLSHITTLLLVAFALCTFLVLYLSLPSASDETRTIIIDKGKSTRQISQTLNDERVIRYPFLFNAAAKACGILGYHLRSGEYEFIERITPMQVLRILVSGKSIIHKFTIPEGSTVHEVISRLRAEPVLRGEINDDVTEGFLMPSTYFFTFGETRQKLLSQMKRGITEALSELMPSLSPDSPLKSRLDVLTLASIVEKESYLESEKPLIAAVFLNRLKKKMRLQADPTTIYAITLGKYKLTRLLTKNDLSIKSPYNTYYASGLPPSPIACPSRSAIEAVINPAKTDDLYFVVNGLGGHSFSCDLKLHNANVSKYRKMVDLPPTVAGPADK